MFVLWLILGAVIAILATALEAVAVILGALWTLLEFLASALSGRGKGRSDGDG